MSGNFYLEAFIKSSGERLGYMGASGGNYVEFFGYGEPNKTPEEVGAYKLYFYQNGGKNYLRGVDHSSRYLGGTGQAEWALWGGDPQGVVFQGEELWMTEPKKALSFYGYFAKKEAEWNDANDPNLPQNILILNKIPC